MIEKRAANTRNNRFILYAKLNDLIVKNDTTLANWWPEDLKFSNFFCYGENNQIPFKDLSGITGISGNNAVGKSSAIEILYYTLFGDTYRKTPVFKLVNDKKNNANSEVIFNVNNVRYKIYRTIKINDNDKIDTTVKIENLTDSTDNTLPTGKREIKDWIKNKKEG